MGTYPECYLMRVYRIRWEADYWAALAAAIAELEHRLSDIYLVASITDGLDQSWFDHQRRREQAAHAARWAQYCVDSAAAWLPHATEARLVFPDDACLAGGAEAYPCAALVDVARRRRTAGFPVEDAAYGDAFAIMAGESNWAHYVVAVAGGWADAVQWSAEAAAEAARELALHHGELPG